MAERISNTSYRMMRNFYPGPNSIKAKKILKLSRQDLKLFVEIITGQNNLNYLNKIIFGLTDLCQFCEEEKESFIHMINECPCFT